MALLLPFKFFTKKEETGKKAIHCGLLLIPAMCDVTATIFDSTGLIYVSLFILSYYVPSYYKQLKAANYDQVNN